MLPWDELLVVTRYQVGRWRSAARSFTMTPPPGCRAGAVGRYPMGAPGVEGSIWARRTSYVTGPAFVLTGCQESVTRLYCPVAVMAEARSGIVGAVVSGKPRT